MPNSASQFVVDSSNPKVSTLESASTAESSLETDSTNPKISTLVSVLNTKSLLTVDAVVYSNTGASYRSFLDWESTPDFTVASQGVQLIFGNSGFPVGANSTVYIVAAVSTVEDEVKIPLPSVTMSELYVNSSLAPGTSQSFTYTVLKNGLATALSAVVTGSGSTSASDTGESIVFSAGDTFSLRVVTTSGATECSHSFSVKID